MSPLGVLSSLGAQPEAHGDATHRAHRHWDRHTGDRAHENGRMEGLGHTGRSTLTLIADEEAHAGAAAVGGEEQAQGVPGAEEELRCLCAVVLSDQRGRAGRPVPHLQGVVVDLRLEPVHVDIGQKSNQRSAVFTDRHPVTASPIG